MRKRALTVAACAALLYAGAALASTTPQEQCDSTRIVAWTKYLSCVNGLVAKIAKFTSFDFYASFAKCRHKYFTKWTKFQTTGSLAGSTCIGSRFNDNGATVTDKLTGMEWEKKTNDSSIHDKDNTYAWDAAFSQFTSALGSVCSLGRCDWRLPTEAELLSIVLDFECKGGGLSPTCSCASIPCIDPAFDVSNTQFAIYWSATRYVSASSKAWWVRFDSGFVSASEATNPFYVRAVRGGW